MFSHAFLMFCADNGDISTYLHRGHEQLGNIGHPISGEKSVLEGDLRCGGGLEPVVSQAGGRHHGVEPGSSQSQGRLEGREGLEGETPIGWKWMAMATTGRQSILPPNPHPSCKV